MIHSKSYIAILILFLLIPLNAFCKEATNSNHAVIDFLKSVNKEANNLSLFATAINLKLLTKSQVFEISTADTIPLRIWHLVVDKSGGKWILSYNDIEKINKFIIAQDLNLKNKRDYMDYSTLFLTLACDDEKPIDYEKIKDKTNIKDEFKYILINFKFDETQDKSINMTFFSRNSTGSIKMWRLLIKATGEITKLDKTLITYN